MAKCYVCGRSAKSGNSRSHSNIATKRKFKINLQTKKTGREKKANLHQMRQDQKQS